MSRKKDEDVDEPGFFDMNDEVVHMMGGTVGGTSSEWGYGQSSKGKGNGKSVFVGKCRHEPTAVYSIEGITYYGGSERKVEDFTFDSEWLVISLMGSALGGSSSSPVVRNGSPQTIPEEFIQKLRGRERGSAVNHIIVNWRDYGPAPVTGEFFSDVHSFAKERGIKNVLFYCVGGHGRTGTALSAMLVVMCRDKTDSAVAYVRKNYCKEAVESKTQFEYLDSLVQKPV